MKKVILIIGLVAILFCVATQVRAIDQTGKQSLLVQLQQQISKISQQIGQIFGTQTAALSATSNCTDSDSGRDYFKKGTINYTYLGADKTATDYCSSASNLMEYFCSSGSAFGETKVCDNGCQDGACVNTANGPVSAAGPVLCKSNWNCTDWSVCSYTGTQTRTCVDSNKCVNPTDQPALSQLCQLFKSSCSDSDGGKDYFTQGYVSYTSGEALGRITDSCYDSNTLQEYFCDYPTSSTYNVEYIKCQNGCSDGMCNPTTTCTPNWVCTDWTACSGGQQTRICDDKNICGNNDTRPDQSKTCSLISCTDSDGGKVYSTKGTVSYAGKNYVDYCYEANSLWLGEFSCSNNVESFEWYQCPNGCQDGACKAAAACTPSWQIGAWGVCTNGQQTRTVTDSNQCGVTTNKPAETQTCNTTSACTDSDNGKTYSTKGTVNYGGQNYFDYCYTTNPTWLAEYYCDNGVGKYEWYQCPNGCQDGACKAGTTSCIPAWTCSDWSACSLILKQDRVCSDTNQCGVDTGKPAESQDCTCGLTNATKDYFIKGSIYYNGLKTDYCYNNSNWLTKYYCDGGVGKSEQYFCPVACKDGACITGSCTPNWQVGEWSACDSTLHQTRTVTDANNCGAGGGAEKPATTQACRIQTQGPICTDTDSGKDYFTKGTVAYDSGAGTKATYTDSCNGSNYLYEYYCLNGSSLVETKTCDYGCSDGACNKSACTPSWQVGAWSNCTAGLQTRIVTDSNNCGTTLNKPVDNQKCLCVPNWQLSGAWSDCSYDGTQKQDYVDVNQCGTTSGIPDPQKKACCYVNWQCSWGQCINGSQSQTLIDSNNCGQPVSSAKISCSQTRACVVTVCTPDWKIGPWSTCANGQQTRSVTDNNNCGVATNQPAVSQSCFVNNAVCVDSDNGKDYFTKGVLSYGGKDYTDYCFANNPQWLAEFYCDGATGKYEWYQCPNGCQDGVCKTTGTPCTPKWQITEDWSACTNGQQTRKVVDLNSCQTSDGKPATSQSCCTPSWQIGQWSACANSQQTRTVTDSNQCGTTTGKPAETQSCCSSNWQVGEWTACYNGKQSRYVTDLNKCITPTDKPDTTQSCQPVTHTCTDSDNGKNYSTLGSIVYDGKTNADYCYEGYQVPASQGSWVPGGVVEYYCDNNNIGLSEKHVCDCKDGVCLTTSCKSAWKTGPWLACLNGKQTRDVWDSNNCSVPTTDYKPADSQNCCFDSDGVTNYSVKGTLYYGNSILTDYCWPNSNFVVEYYCNPSSNTTTPYSSELHPCPNGCQDGVCVQSGSCTPNWQIGAWSDCTNSQQTRTVTDSNQCGTTTGKPAETQLCTVACEPAWSCTNWSTCPLSGYQTRTCTDSKQCGTNNGKPAEQQGCSNYETCTDSDNGKTYSTKGTVLFGNQFYNDYCYAYNPAWLAESYCDNGVVKYEWYQCPNSCQDGVCKSTTTNCTPSWIIGDWGACINGQQTRTVTDSNQCGIVTGKPAETQTCVSVCTPSWRTGDWGACNNGQQTRDVTDSNKCGIDIDKPAATQSCSISCVPIWTCTDWSACLNSQQTRVCSDSQKCGVSANKPAESQKCIINKACNDSDGGKDYFTKGSVTYGNSNFVDYCLSNNPSQLIEYYCSDFDQASYEQYTCANGCLNGACKNATTNCTPEWSCTAWGSCSNGQQTRVCSDSQKCGVSTNKPVETQSCFSSCTPEWSCTAWGSCLNGKQNRDCSDNKKCGVNTNKPAETQACIVCNPVWTCTNWSTCSDSNQQARTCTDSKKCGVTTGKPAETQGCSRCVDSDNGKDYFTKGTLIFDGQSYKDYCEPTDSNFMLEYYCDDNGLLGIEMYQCPNGCSSGRCNKR